MPTLNWIGKDKVVTHHQDVPFNVLEHNYGFTAEGGKQEAETHSGNMIIHGDNLMALKSLLPQYEGRVDCIYIDPPYNTGKEGWVYNDNVNDSHIKKWLGEIVGKQGEDLSRHDKWLCMMYPRLRLLEKLLSSDGSLVMSIGYHELASAIKICTDIFHTKQIVPVTVQTSGGKPSKGFNYLHEYLIFVVNEDIKPIALDFAGGNSRSPFEGLTLSTFDKINRPNQVYPIFINPETKAIVGVGESLQTNIDKGLYTGEKKDYDYDFSVAPTGTVAVWPITSKGKHCVWRLISTRLMEDWNKGYIKVSPNTKKEHPNKFSVQYLPEGVISKVKSGSLTVIGNEEGLPTLIFGENETEGNTIPTIWNEKSFYTVNGTNLLKVLFPEREKTFDYPKSLNYIKSIIRALTKEDDIVLDSFGGSATTAHAVLSLNEEDELDRKFIIIEMMDYADTITAERTKRVIQGYTYKGKQEEEIFNEKFTIKKLEKFPEMLERANQAIEEHKNEYTKISKPKIADNSLKVIGTKEYDGIMPGLGGAFDFYELGKPLFDEDGFLNEEVEKEKIREYIYYSETQCPLTELHKEEEKYLLGSHNHTDYYFYYEPKIETTFGPDTLNIIVRKADSYIVYADTCLFNKDELAKLNIIFKKIPRDIHRF